MNEVSVGSAQGGSGSFSVRRIAARAVTAAACTATR